MAVEGKAVLLVYNDYDGADDLALNDWYVREHLAERVGPLPGFNRARRFEAVGAAPRYLALYELDSPAALTTQNYRSLPRSDAHSATFIGHFSGHAKGVFVLRASAGAGDGAYLGFLTCALDSENDAQPGAALVKQLGECLGVISVQALTIDTTTRPAKPTEQGRESGQPAPFVLIIEALTQQVLADVRVKFLQPSSLSQAGCGKEDIFGVYRFLHALTAPRLTPSEA